MIHIDIHDRTLRVEHVHKPGMRNCTASRRWLQTTNHVATPTKHPSHEHDSNCRCHWRPRLY